MKHRSRRESSAWQPPLLRGAILGAALLSAAGCATHQLPPPTAWRVEPVFQAGNADRVSEAHYSIGRRHDRDRAWSLAAESYRKAIAADPRNVEAHNALGVALSRVGRHEEAVAALRSGLALDPARPHVRSNLGNALRRAGRPQDAVAELKQALVLDANDSIASANLRLALAQTDPVASGAGDDRGDHPPPQALWSSPGDGPSPGAASATGAAIVTAMEVADVPTIPSLQAPVTASLDGSLVAPQVGVPLPPVHDARSSTPDEPLPLTFPERMQPRIEIANGNGVVGMAARLGHSLRIRGLVRHALLTNVLPFTTPTTVVHYRQGFRGIAERIAATAPYRITLATAAGGAAGADVRVVLGRDVRGLDPCAGGCASGRDRVVASVTDR